MFSFFCVAQSCCFVNHCLSFCHFAFWPLCCQPFFDLKLLVTTLVTSSFDFNRLNGFFYLSFTNCTCCRWTDSDVKDLYVDVLIPTSKQWGNEFLESDTNHHSQSAFALCIQGALSSPNMIRPYTLHAYDSLCMTIYKDSSHVQNWMN